MSKLVVNGEVCSGTANYASAINYTKSDGTQTTVKDELDNINGLMEGGVGMEQEYKDKIDAMYDKLCEEKTTSDIKFILMTKNATDAEMRMIDAINNTVISDCYWSNKLFTFEDIGITLDFNGDPYWKITFDKDLKYSDLCAAVPNIILAYKGTTVSWNYREMRTFVFLG